MRLPDDAIGKVDHPGQTAQRITRLVLEAAGMDDEHIDGGLPQWCELVSGRYLDLLADSDTSHWEVGPRRSRDAGGALPSRAHRAHDRQP